MLTPMTPSEACKAAVERAGGPKRLANAMAITGSAVSQWEIVPAIRVLQVEKLSGMSRHLLRPDIYGAQAADPAPLQAADG